MLILRSHQLLRLLVIVSLIMLQAAANNRSDQLKVSLPHVRTKRAFFLDFLQKIGITKNLIADQYTDTKNTLNDIYNTVNEQFSDPGPVKPTSRPRPTSEMMVAIGEDPPTTTTESYSISRYELGRILGRNFRGVQRLAQTEFKDSLNATHYNLKEYKAEADKQFANSLAVNKKNKIKSLIVQ
ncbi:hypothetical protein ACLKA6_019424 [Drosophila palustris]